MVNVVSNVTAKAGCVNPNRQWLDSVKKAVDKIGALVSAALSKVHSRDTHMIRLIEQIWTAIGCLIPGSPAW